MASMWCTGSVYWHARGAPQALKPRASSWRRRIRGRNRRGIRVGAVAGIDFGTTHSTISVIQDKTVQAVPVDDTGSLLLPSTVSYSAELEPMVGLLRGSAATENVTLVDNVKRLMGREYAGSLAHQLGYETAPTQDGKIGIHVSGRTLTVAEVSSEIIKVLIDRAEAYLGHVVSEAVMTVPSEYTNDQRLATMDAAALCGISRVSLLQEPVAAAMAHGLGKPEQEEPAILVVDIGGGTCDISLLQSFEGLLEVIGYDGDSQLGGVDLDEAILQHWLTQPQPVCIDEIKEQNPQRWVLWRAEAERCKVALSTESSCNVALQYPGCTSEFRMTREDLQEAAKPFLDRLAVPLQRMAKSHNLAYACGDEREESWDKYAPPPRRVTQLILVGSVTESPVVRGAVENLVGCKCCELEGDRRSCVSRGAAIHAAIMMGALPGGLELSDGFYVQELQSRTSGFQM